MRLRRHAASGRRRRRRGVAARRRNPAVATQVEEQIVPAPRQAGGVRGAPREKVVAAARDLFVAQGYEATSRQEVADRAGVGVQTVTSCSATSAHCSRMSSTRPWSATPDRSAPWTATGSAARAPDPRRPDNCEPTYEVYATSLAGSP
ncbi:TetR/AcrR family transcriptional regulator [Streptomyces polygonati]|uniref:TetR/AcrR family transcriptional regulator n=1 Tax=Streptomyces polygonati TaxID=1617087 RepID=A0ABV8HV04_9ACTN